MPVCLLAFPMCSETVPQEEKSASCSFNAFTFPVKVPNLTTHSLNILGKLHFYGVW